MIGHAGDLNTIENSYATVDISSYSESFTSSSGRLDGASSFAGGLVGRGRLITIKNCYATGDVSAYNSDSRNFSEAGALIGYAGIGSVIENSYATGNVSSQHSANQKSFSGGLIGSADGYNDTSEPIESRVESFIRNNYATGNVFAYSSSGDAYAGGLVGENTSSIKNNYAMGNVFASSSGAAYAGSLLGKNSVDIGGTYINPIINSYRNKDATLTRSGSSGSYTYAGDYRYLAQLKCPTAAGGGCGSPAVNSYVNWSSTIWNFGTTSQYPGLCIGGYIHRPKDASGGGFSIDDNKPACP